MFGRVIAGVLAGACISGASYAQAPVPVAFAPPGQQVTVPGVINRPQAPVLPPGPLFTADQMRVGIHMTAAECAGFRSTVYVTSQGYGVCFRFYKSVAGGSGPEAVVFLDGDIRAEKLDYDPAALDRSVESLSRRMKRPAIHLARMGYEGSSGNFAWRRTWLEVDLTNKALDAIKARFGFTLFHVFGQSGGAHLTGALIGLRTDLGCAVPGAGRLAFAPDYVAEQMRQREAWRRHYDPSTTIRQAARQSLQTRILVVTSPNDQRVPERMQTPFVTGIRQLGGYASQFMVGAVDDLQHGVTRFSREALAGCLVRASDAEIAATLDRMSGWMAQNKAATGAGQPERTDYREVVRPFSVTSPTTAVATVPAAPAPTAPPVAPVPLISGGRVVMAGSR